MPSACSCRPARCCICKNSFRTRAAICECCSSVAAPGPCGAPTRSTGGPTSVACATPEPAELTPQLEELARRAAAAVGAPLAGVDLLAGRDGRLYAIEVNAVPGWRALGQTLGVDIARVVLDFVADECQANRERRVPGGC